MTDLILTEFQDHVAALELVPGSGGAFEIHIDDDLVFSKKQQRRFPEDEEILGPLRNRI